MARSIEDRSEPGLHLDTAVTEINLLVRDAVNFQASELEQNWAAAERYFQGEVDLPDEEGRSTVVKTEMRDAVRNCMPSIMRVLFQARKIVNYRPSSIQHSAWVEQQAEFVCQIFADCGGYMVMHTAIQDALRLKIGIIKTFWEPDPLPEYVKYTGVPFQVVQELIQDPMFTVEDFEQTHEQLTPSGEVELYEVSGHREHENGRICLESVPNYEFFISRNANCIEDAINHGVHGHRAVVAVSEALDLGLDYPNWLELDDQDPEQTEHTTSSAERRGYQKESPNSKTSSDVLRHKFLLTEAYVSYDLKNTGRPQLYCFYLGGSSHKYIDHYEVSDSPFSVMSPNPVSHTVYGHSFFDLTHREQDTGTSLLRALVDNTHAANDSKTFADPNKVNFDDLMNPAINAPVRTKSGAQVQTVQIPFTGQGNLMSLQYLDQDVQNKVGVTKAAQGLDPDAMQSTDKDAVLNTIMTSQGQTELMVRNIIETCLVRVFKQILKLTIQHQRPMQILRTKGHLIPINTGMFDANASAEPAVGLGTASPMQKQAVLQFTLQKQEQYLEKFGPNNPFTSFSQLYNTIEDLLETNGIYNAGRYFNMVTKDVEAEWAKVREQQQQQMLQQQQEAMKNSPQQAFKEVEFAKDATKKAEVAVKASETAQTLRLKALDSAAKDDLERDRMAQDRVIRLAEIAQDAKNQEIKDEQNASKPASTGDKSSSG